MYVAGRTKTSMVNITESILANSASTQVNVTFNHVFKVGIHILNYVAVVSF